MSLLTAKTLFTTNLAKEFDLFFIREKDLNNPNKYFVDPLNSDGSNKTYEEIKIEIKQKNLEFSNTIADLIYNFIKSGEVNFETGTVIGTCPGGPSGGPLAFGKATSGIIS